MFVDGTYQAAETWYGKSGEVFHPGLHYCVGGNSKVYGAALFRFRERDFGALAHADGVSPEWPLTYADFEPFYTEAENLFVVHGQRGEDPCEPPSGGPYPYPPVAHEPRIRQLSEAFEQQGLHPFHLPLGIRLDERNGMALPTSICIRCDAFDGFPCLLNGKADAQVMCVDPALAAYPNFSLLTGALVTRLETTASGREIAAVHVQRGGQAECYTADIVVVACGALSSALLFLRSANDTHPDGLANRSGQVGRNYMRHNQSVLMALMREPNETVFQKTLAVSDYYFGADDYPYPLGLIQMCATSHADQIKAEALPAWLDFAPSMPLRRWRVIRWISGCPPRTSVGENPHLLRWRRVRLDLTETNLEAHRRLKKKLEQHLSASVSHPVLLERSLYLGKNIRWAGRRTRRERCGSAPIRPPPSSI